MEPLAIVVRMCPAEWKAKGALMNFPNFHLSAGRAISRLLQAEYHDQRMALLEAFCRQVVYGPWRWQLLASLNEDETELVKGTTKNEPQMVDYFEFRRRIGLVCGFVESSFAGFAGNEPPKVAGHPELNEIMDRLQNAFQQTRGASIGVELTVGLMAILNVHPLSLTLGACGPSSFKAVVAYAEGAGSGEGIIPVTQKHVDPYLFGANGPGWNQHAEALIKTNQAVGVVEDTEQYLDMRLEHRCLRGFARATRLPKPQIQDFDGHPLTCEPPSRIDLFDISAANMPGSPLSMLVSDPWLAACLYRNPEDPYSEYPIRYGLGSLRAWAISEGIDGNLESLLREAVRMGFISECGSLTITDLLTPSSHSAPSFERFEVMPEKILAQLGMSDWTDIGTYLSGSAKSLTDTAAIDTQRVTVVVSALRFAVNRFMAYRRFHALSSLLQKPFLCTIFGGVAMESEPHSLESDEPVAIESLYLVAQTSDQNVGRLACLRSRLGGRLLLDARLSAIDGHILVYDLHEVSHEYQSPTVLDPSADTQIRQLWKIERLARQTMVISEVRKPSKTPPLMIQVPMSYGRIELPVGTMSAFVGFPESGKSRCAHKFAATARTAMKQKGIEAVVTYAMIEEPFQPQPMVDDPEVAAMVNNPSAYQRLHIAAVWPDAIKLISNHLLRVHFNIAKDDKKHLILIVDGGTPAFGYTVEGIEPATTTGGVRMIVRQYCAALSFLTHDQFSLFVLFTMPRLHRDIQDAYYQAISGGSTNTFMVMTGGQIGQHRLRFSGKESTWVGTAGNLAPVFDPLSHFNQISPGSFDRETPSGKLFDNGQG